MFAQLRFSELGSVRMSANVKAGARASGGASVGASVVIHMSLSMNAGGARSQELQLLSKIIEKKYKKSIISYE